MVQWEIVQQKAGITDTMRINILSTINTAINTYGESEKFKIAADVSNWLEATYGKKWGVVIGDTDTFKSIYSYYESKYLVVNEKGFGWRIEVFQQIP
jgi:hypothetical protein